MINPPNNNNYLKLNELNIVRFLNFIILVYQGHVSNKAQ